MFRVPGRYEVRTDVEFEDDDPRLRARDAFRQGQEVLLRRVDRDGLVPEETARLRRDFLRLRRLRHPSIAALYDVHYEESEDTWIVASEAVRGAPLTRVLGEVSEERGLDIVAQVCRTLLQLHHQGFLHLDLHPDAVPVTPHPEGPLPVICDVGLRPRSAREIARLSEPRRSFLAPEIAAGEGGDTRSDVFSLGRMLEVAWGPDAPASAQRPHLWPVIENMTAALPEQRPAGFEEVLRALSTAVGRHLVATRTRGRSRMGFGGHLVGRSAELQRLESVVRRVLHGEGGGLFLIEGGGGLGKSCLLDETGAIARLEGIRVVATACDRSRSRPLFALRDVLRQLVQILPTDHPALVEGSRVLSELLPDLLPPQRVRPDEPSGLNAEQQRVRLENALADFLSRTADVRPLVVLLDDLQWIDRGSLDVLLHFVSHMSGAPVQFIATRDPQLASAEPGLDALLEDVERIELTALGDSEVGELVGSFMALDEGTRELGGLVRRMTGGVPVYVEELLRGLLEGEVSVLDGLDEGERDAETAARRAGELLELRLERLGRPARRLLEAIVVFDGPVARSLAVRVAGLPEDAVEPALGVLQDADLVAIEATRVEPLLGVRSELCRAVVSRDMGPERRACLHDLAAWILAESRETGRPGRAAELAYHAQRGSEPARALPHAREAAREAMSLHACDQARRLLERALEAREGDDSEEASEARRELSEVLERTGDMEGALARLEEALEARPGDPALLVRVGDLQRMLGRFEAAEATLATALEAARDAGDRVLCCRAERSLGNALFRRGEYDAARHHLEAAEAWLGERDDPRERSRNASALGLISWYQGDLQDAESQHRESRRQSLRARDPLGVATAHVNQGLVLWNRGRLAQALWRFRRAEVLARRLGHYLMLAVALQNRGIVEFELGRLTLAVRTLKESLRMRRRLGDSAGVARTLANLGLAHHAMGRHGLAAELIESSIAGREGVGDRQGEANGHLNLARVLLRVSGFTEAESHLDQAAEIAASIGLPGFHSRVETVRAALALQQGQLEVATRAAERAEACNGVVERATQAAEVDLVRAEIARREGKTSVARIRVARALRAARASRKADLLAEARFLSGRLREGAAGLASLAAAQHLADRHGYRELAWIIRSVRGRRLVEAGQRDVANEILREAMELLRELHDDLPEGWREAFLEDPEKQELRRAFAASRRGVTVGVP